MVEVEKEIGFEQLERQVRHIPMLEPLDGVHIFPYKDADIRLEEIRYSDIRPTTLYVLRQNLHTQARLTDRLGQLGYDPLALDGALELRNEAGDTHGLLPPLVEETPVDGVYLLDGIHRNYQQRQLGRTTFTALFITGIDERCPSYAYPNAWDDIVEYDEVPEDPTLKKRYRDNPKSLYRNFGVLGTGGPRS